MKKNLLKTVLVAIGLAAGTTGAWAGVWSTIFEEDYNDASTFNKFWSSASTGRYTVNQTARSGGEDGDYVMEIKPVGTGSNGTSITYTGLTTSNSAVDSYQKTDLYRISFEFNFCYNNKGQNPYFVIYNSEGSEVIKFASTSNTSTDGSITINGKTLEETFTLSNSAATPTTYNAVTIYTETKDGVTGTYMDITWAGSETATTYTIDAANVVHIGKLVHNTKRYSNHFVFDNLKVELYSENEVVAAPQAAVTAINGKERTVAITAQVSSHKLYYYFGDDSENPKEYTTPFTVSESSTLHYYAESESGTKSDVQELVLNCVDITLTAPTITHTGSYTYKIEGTQPATDGVTPVPTIHYTVNGGEEQTATGETTISGVNGDIVVAWAVADGYTTSSKTTQTYVSEFVTYDVWSYDLNSYPSTYGVTKIADVIDESTKATINGNENMYNLKNIDMKDLYVENSTGWLIRNQTSNAFKTFSASASIAINNVTTNDVIYFAGSCDGNKYSIASVTNGSVAYDYSLDEYFIVPETDGAVTITLNTGVNVSTVKVCKRNVIKTISASKFASFSAAGNTEVPEGVSVYTAKVDGNNVVLTKVETSVIPANTGVIVGCETEGEKTFKVTLNGSDADFSANELIATSVEENATVPTTGTYYALSATEAKFGVLTGGIKLSANKAYLAAPADKAKQTSLNIVFGGETTGISEAASAKTIDNGAFYTLQGVRVAKPAKGLYIHNGKKVLVK